MIAETGGKHSASVVAGLTKSLKPSEVIKIFPTTNRRYVAKAQKIILCQSALALESRSANTTKHLSVCDEEADLYEEFFNDHTSNKSGDKTVCRELRLRLHDFDAELYAKYPRYLRSMASANPVEFDLEELKRKRYKSRFDRSVLSALLSGESSSFDQVQEYTTRKKKAQEDYVRLLEKKQTHHYGDTG